MVFVVFIDVPLLEIVVFFFGVVEFVGLVTVGLVAVYFCKSDCDVEASLSAIIESTFHMELLLLVLVVVLLYKLLVRYLDEPTIVVELVVVFELVVEFV